MVSEKQARHLEKARVKAAEAKYEISYRFHFDKKFDRAKEKFLKTMSEYMGLSIDETDSIFEIVNPYDEIYNHPKCNIIEKKIDFLDI